MAKAMGYATVFKILLTGGHIVWKSPSVHGKQEFKVMMTGEGLSPDKCVGHITEKQFGEMSSVGLLAVEGKMSADKYGNVYSVFRLANKEK